VKTKPIGYANQEDFINGSVLISTSLELSALQNKLKQVEQKLKRIRTANKNGPRAIDLDVIVWDGEIIDADVYARPFLHDAVKELWPGLLKNGK
jgi:2-amino-4-hydroxy-6-hydroxymethyldihydropteridine diphosphokinase